VVETGGRQEREKESNSGSRKNHASLHGEKKGKKWKKKVTRGSITTDKKKSPKRAKGFVGWLVDLSSRSRKGAVLNGIQGVSKGDNSSGVTKKAG